MPRLNRCAAGVTMIAGLAINGVASAQDDVQAQLDAAKARVAALEAQLEAAKTQVEAAQADLAATLPPPGPTPEPSWREGWEGSVEAGLNGSDGNTETFSLRIGLNATRSTERYDTAFLATYSYKRENSENTENRFYSELRNDWKIEDSKWRYFALGSAEINEFQDWDAALVGIGGVGYEFFDNDKTKLVGRIGAGGTYEIGGDDEGFRPEGYLALDLAHKLTERQSVTFTSEYFPSLEDFGEFRWVNRAGYQIMIDPEVNMFLRAGVEHRHDSDPGDDFEQNDIDYFLTLGWSF